MFMKMRYSPYKGPLLTPLAIDESTQYEMIKIVICVT